MILAMPASALAVRGKWAKSILADRGASTPTIAASRFSIYPKTTSDQSLKATIKRAVSGIGGLGLDVQADDVSSIVTGSSETVFEAMQGVLGRASNVEGRPHVSMQCTISSDVVDIALPTRSADANEWSEAEPARVAAQFAVYSIAELGTCSDDVIALASASPCFKADKELCTMLDGDGAEVFRVLRESYALACSRSVSGHVVLTATLTCNKASWKSDKERADDAQAIALATEAATEAATNTATNAVADLTEAIEDKIARWKVVTRKAPLGVPPFSGSPTGNLVVSAPGRGTDDDGEANTAEAGDAREAAESLQSLLLTRRTVNEILPELPTGWEASLERAVAAAIMAPNHKRTEPWRFHLLGPKRVRAVCELNAELVREAGKGDAAAEKKLKRWLAMPGWLVVTRVMLPGEVEDEDEDEDGSTALAKPNGQAREDYAAVCCAIQNLCLSLHADGLGTKWTTGPVNFEPRFAAAAGLPDGEEVCGTLWFGTPAVVPLPPKKKLGVADVLRRSD